MTRRVTALMAAALLGASLALANASAAFATATGSALTVAGHDRFSSLRVTVSQTQDLVNQSITVSWTGGKRTVPANGQFDQNYMQIMQCWGDDPAGPKRGQCEYGGKGSDGRGGAWANSRQVSYGSLVDKNETYTKDLPPLTNAFVPFASVDCKDADIEHCPEGTVARNGQHRFYDDSTTNEITYARTSEAGTGVQYFEVDTALEAPWLGCGQTTSRGTIRSCWLVVVPRDDLEVDGVSANSESAVYGGGRVVSSPLSASNWEQRIVVPLRFQSVSGSCPIGSVETPVVGDELITEAMNRWAPKMCEGHGPVFGFSQVPDNVAHSNLMSSTPGLAFVSTPVPPALVPPDRRIRYAPVAIDGLAIAYNIERKTPDTDASGNPTPPGVRSNDGNRYDSLNLTPRLVAKLLTQSYRDGVDQVAPEVKNNPLEITLDPDFQQYNKNFAYQDYTGLGDMITTLGQSDATSALWRWINADKDARAFLDGAKDPWGMTVNPHYLHMQLPVPEFPKSDLFCAPKTVSIELEHCTFDEHPYAGDMHEATRNAARGDNLSRNAYSVDIPHSWKRTGPQPSGSRAVLTITDAATAARYGLPTAKLRNAAGVFVAPTAAGLMAGVKAAVASDVSGVVVGNPLTKVPTAYPLTTVTYAAAAPALLTPSAGKAYSALLRYAAGAGQISGVKVGELPIGYLPLPATWRAQTMVTAGLLAAEAGKPYSPSTEVPSEVASPNGGAPAGAAKSAPATPGAQPGSAASASPTATFAYAAQSTPVEKTGALRWALLTVLIVGGLAASAGPVLQVLGKRRGG